ncbi:MAG: hypothetical protein WCF04_14615 [Candidatus Nanopelagicales bacterium]
MVTLRMHKGAGEYSAYLSVDGRPCEARPMRGSGLGEATGLAVIAATEQEVLDAAGWMPGRILVLCGEAITPAAVPVIINSAQLATFRGIVVITDDQVDLGHMGDTRLPIPIVYVHRQADQAWMRRAVRVTVGVQAVGDHTLDVRSVRAERPRRTSAAAVLGVPGTVRH